MLARSSKLTESKLGNDHIAFRSLKRPGDGIEVFKGLFQRLGWEPRRAYEFQDAHLTEGATYAHPKGLPRIFVSQLKVDELEGDVRSILDKAALPAVPQAEPA